MTPETRAKRLAELRAKLAAWRPERYASPAVAKGVKTRLEHAIARLEREQDNIRRGRPPGWRPDVP